jgi:hypothetical protein
MDEVSVPPTFAIMAAVSDAERPAANSTMMLAVLTGGVVVSAGGVTVSAGGVTASAGGVAVSAGGDPTVDGDDGSVGFGDRDSVGMGDASGLVCATAGVVLSPRYAIIWTTSTRATKVRRIGAPLPLLPICCPLLGAADPSAALETRVLPRVRFIICGVNA